MFVFGITPAREKKREEERRREKKREEERIHSNEYI